MIPRKNHQGDLVNCKGEIISHLYNNLCGCVDCADQRDLDELDFEIRRAKDAKKAYAAEYTKDKTEHYQTNYGPYWETFLYQDAKIFSDIMYRIDNKETI